MLSFWEKQDWIKDYDYTVVGCGIVGLMTALSLRETYPEASIIILEKGKLPSGASTKNAGFACYGTVGEILDDLEGSSEAELLATLKLRWKGLEILSSKVPSTSINYMQHGGYEVFRTKDDYTQCLEKLEKVNILLDEATGIKDTIRPFSLKIGNMYHEVLHNPLEAQINPVLLVRYLIQLAQSKGIRIEMNKELISYNDTGDKVTLQLENLEFKSQILILTTNAFTLPQNKNLDIIPARNQVIVSKQIPDMSLKGTYHIDRGYIYFRNIGNRLLIGGARNIDSENEQTDRFGKNEKIIKYLSDLVRKEICIASFEPEYTWTGIIATGSSKQPIIERISPQVYCAVRMGGMGVAIGSAVGQKVVELVKKSA